MVLANFTSNAGYSFVDIDNTATDGDPGLRFLLGGSGSWIMGVDDSDSDNFKIGTGSLLTSANKVSIDTSGNVGIVGKVSATSATLSQITSLAHYIGGGHTRAQKPVAVWVGGTAAAATYPAGWNELAALYLDTDNYLYICTEAGSPGTWLAIAYAGTPCPQLCVLETNPSGATETRLVGYTLQGFFAPEITGTDTEDVSGQTAATYAIRGTQKETSYVSSATLTIDGVVYAPVSYTPPRAKAGGRYEIRKGEQLAIAFPVAPRADQSVQFSATGYYEIGEDARGWPRAFRNMERLTLMRAKSWVQGREAAIRADAQAAIQKVRDDAAAAIAAERQARLSDKAAFQTELNAIKTRLTTLEGK
jgi:hypothetical protein